MNKLCALIAALMALAAVHAHGANALIFPNSDFENGDLTNWTKVSGNAWDLSPETANPFGGYPNGSNYPQGTHGATTIWGYNGSDTRAGVLRSANFKAVGDAIEFYIVGWADPKLRVELRKAADNSVVQSISVPVTSPDLKMVAFENLSALANQDLYLEIIDEISGVAGWIGVDYFHWRGMDDVCFPNSDFEYATALNWTQTGTAFGSAVAYFTNGVYPPPRDEFCATSLVVPGAATLKSVDFKAKRTEITFDMAGFLAPEIKVNLRLAADDSLVDSEQMTATAPTFESRKLMVGTALNQQVYLEVVDSAPGSLASDPWLAVDNFRFSGDVPVELSSFSAE